MRYLSTRPNDEKVSFKEAVINGLTNNGGLYLPEEIPTLAPSFFENIESMENNEIAFQAIWPFVQGSLSEEQLKDIIGGTITFPTPVVHVENDIHVLELFHGPTQAFKDVGARFMSRCLSHFYADNEGSVTVLVATSGDTGSAVAHGFYEVPGVEVKILFPKGKVSDYQQYQMTSLGKNITAIEVEGTFDDCQKLVKQAFKDDELNKKLSLSSANSINVARLLPQMLYYFFAYKQLKSKLGGKKLVVSVPSGNLGNITAGLVAKRMGLPIERFIASHNANDTFYQFIQTGDYKAKPSVQTYSNAMDVGDPSNFERIHSIYKEDLNAIKKDVSALTFDDNATLQEIDTCYKQTRYLCDPHGAVGKLALDQDLKDNELGVFLETAAPQKFADVIEKVLPDYSAGDVDLSKCKKLHIANDYETFVNIIKS